MLPIAHIASALVVNRVAGLYTDIAPAVAGALLPDAIDKTLAWVLGVVPAARHAGHTPVAVAVFGLASSVVIGRRWGAAFASAYVTHLVGDLWQHGHVPWLMPFKRYHVRGERWSVGFDRPTLLLEAIGLATIVVLARRPAGRGEPDTRAALSG